MSKKLLINKPSNIIDEYKKWFQIFELSGAFNTINSNIIDEEGRIYIDEIWGNTWQDSGSKNLFDGELEPGNYHNGIGGVNQTDYRSVNKIYVKPGTVYSIYQEDDTNFLRIHAYRYDGTYIQYVGGGNNKQFTTPDKCAYIYFHVPKGNLTLETKISIVEGNIRPTEYIPYHKADLSNIQHVGELVSVGVKSNIRLK